MTQDPIAAPYFDPDIRETFYQFAVAGLDEKGSVVAKGIECARMYSTPGAVVIGHAIHPAVTHVYPQLLDIIRTRGLTLVTLNDVHSPIR